jgi:hypothetical protein
MIAPGRLDRDVQRLWSSAPDPVRAHGIDERRNRREHRRDPVDGRR